MERHQRHPRRYGVVGVLDDNFIDGGTMKARAVNDGDGQARLVLQHPRHGFYVDDQGTRVWYFLAHSASTCDECEFPFGNERKHPRDPDCEDLRVLCDGARVRLVD